MASVAHQDQLTILRAIAHARMYVTSGRGLESIVHVLIGASLGHVSEQLVPVMKGMQGGLPASAAVQDVIEETEDPYLRSFLAALLADGDSATKRLDELAEELHAERKQQAETYGQKLARIVDFIAILFVAAFFPTILRILERIPPNPIVPQVSLPGQLEWIWYMLLSLALIVLLILARIK